MRKTTALLAASGLLFSTLSPASAQLLKVPALTGTGARMGGLTGAASVASVIPSLAQPSASLSSTLLPVALPSLTPVLLRAQASAALAPAARPVARAAVRTHAVLKTLASDPSIKAALSGDSKPGEKAAALDSFYNGARAGSAFGEQPFSSPAGGVSADTIQNAYGFYSWLSGLPEMAQASYALKARVLIAAEPLLAKGPVIAMEEGGSLTLLSLNDPMTPPAKASLEEPADDEVAPREKHLAGRLEAAAQADAREHTFTNTAALMNRLSNVVREAPVELEIPEAPKIGTGEMPLDPVRRPREYLDRLLRDAMRAEDPFEALELLDKARSEARQRLNYQDGSRFLERLHAQGGLLVPVFVPGLLENMQLAAAEADRTKVERNLDAAFKFVEYGPKWKDRVNAAARRAYDTMDLLETYGPVDEETGLPAQPSSSREVPGEPAGLGGGPARPDEASGEDAAPDQAE